MSEKSPQEVPDLLYAMNSPCGTGHQFEFLNAASKTVHGLTLLNEKLFNLRKSIPEDDDIEKTCAQFHGFAHTLSTLSPLIDLKTESMKRFVYAHQYQGDMDGEFFVRAVHTCLDKIRKQEPPFERNGDVTREAIRDFIHEEFEKEASIDKWVNRRDKGHKGAFYFAKPYYCTLFEFRQKFGFEDDQIHYSAEQSSWTDDWKDNIKHGAHFLIRGQRQTYRDIINVHDEGFAIMIDRIAGVIEHFQGLIRGAKSEEEVTNQLTGGDVLNAFLSTNEIPHNPYFEQQFGL